MQNDNSARIYPTKTRVNDGKVETIGKKQAEVLTENSSSLGNVKYILAT